MGRFPHLHIALAVFQAFDNEGNVALLEGVQHTAAIPLYAENAFEAHVLKMVGRKRLFAAQHITDLAHGKPRMLLQQMDNAKPERMCYSLQDERNAFEFFSFFGIQYTLICVHTSKGMNICSWKQTREKRKKLRCRAEYPTRNIRNESGPEGLAGKAFCTQSR